MIIADLVDSLVVLRCNSEYGREQVRFVTREPWKSRPVKGLARYDREIWVKEFLIARYEASVKVSDLPMGKHKLRTSRINDTPSPGRSCRLGRAYSVAAGHPSLEDLIPACQAQVLLSSADCLVVHRQGTNLPRLLDQPPVLVFQGRLKGSGDLLMQYLHDSSVLAASRSVLSRVCSRILECARLVLLLGKSHMGGRD